MPAVPNALRSVAWFVALCMALAGASALASAAMPQLVPFVLALGPALIAFAIAWSEGSGSLRRLVHSLGRRPMDVRWYLVIALPVVWALGTVALGIVMGRSTADPFKDVLPSVLIVPLVVLLPAFAEEIGWRAFAIPRLITVMSPLRASLLLAVPWTVMHLVLMLPGGINEGLALWGAVLSLASYSVVLTWVFLGSGSVFLAVLVHAGLNGVVPLMRGIDSETSWALRAVLAAVIAIAIVALGGFRHLRSPAQPDQKESPR